MGRKRIVPNKAKIAQVIARGLSVAECATELGVSVSTFYIWLRELDLKLNPSLMKSLSHASLTRWIAAMGGENAVRTRLQAGIDEGKDTTELMVHMGCSYPRIKSLLDKFSMDVDKFSVSERKLLDKGIADGLGYHELSKVVGRSAWSVRRYMDNKGLTVKAKGYILSGEELDKIKGGIEQGMRRGELADLMGYNYQRLQRVLKANDLTLKSRVNISPVDKQIAMLRAEGQTLQEIGDQVGLTREGVRLSLVKQGLGGKISNLKRKVKPKLLEQAEDIYGDKIIEALLGGKTFEELSEEWLVSEGILRTIARNKGWKKEKIKHDNEKLNEVIKDIDSMESLKNVAEDMGIKPMSLYIKLLRKKMWKSLTNRGTQEYQNMTREEFLSLVDENTRKKDLIPLAKRFGIRPLSLQNRYYRLGVKIPS